MNVAIGTTASDNALLSDGSVVDPKQTQTDGQLAIDPNHFQTEGWWRIGPNQCANVVKGKLTNRFVYVYAQDVFGQPILTGTTQMCIVQHKFAIRGDTQCWTRGFVSAGFVEVDTGGNEATHWTLFLAPTP